MYGQLSKFIHTPEEFVTRVEHGGKTQLKGEITCSAATYYNEKQLIEWSKCYQKIFAIMLKTIAEFHPEAFKTDSGKDAVSNIRSEMKKYGKLITISAEVKQILRILPA